MAIIVEGPGGVEVEFPDGTPHDVINDAMSKHFGSKGALTPVEAAPTPTPTAAPEPVVAPPAAEGFQPLPARLQGMRTKGQTVDAPNAPLAGVGNALAKGATMNWWDELAAGAEAPFVDKTYRDILAERRTAAAEFERDWPEQAALGEKLGAGATSLGGGIGALRLAGPAAGLARTALAEAGVSGLLGAAEETGKLEGEQSGADYARAALEGSAVPAVIGGGVPVVGRGIGAVAGPWANAAAQYLAERGVRMTPGEIMGGRFRKLEDAAGSIPIIGDMIQARRMEGVDTFNRAAWDEALPPHMRLPADVEMGHQAVAEARRGFNREYGHIVPQLEAQPDADYVREMAGVRNRVPRRARAEFLDDYQDIVTENVENGMLTGRGIQNALERLRKRAQNLRRSNEPYATERADALMATRDAIEHSAERHSRSSVLEDYQSLQRAYRRYVPLRDAASRLGTEAGIASETPGAGGVFRPAQLTNAIRTADTSAGHGRFAEGELPMQDFARTAKNVMGQQLPNSGTADRLALMSAIGLGGAFAPQVTAGAAAGLGTLAALYSRPGSRAFQAMATYSPQTRALLRRAIGRAAAAGAPMAAEEFTGE